MKYLKKIQYNSPVVLTFALISIAALFLNWVSKGKTNELLFCVYPSNWFSPLTWIRMFGHVLGHANLSHYTNNMLLFLILGPMLEEKYGSKLFMAMLLIVAGITGLFFMLFFNGALLGASGIVFMCIVLASVVGVKEGQIPLTLIVVFIIYIGQEIIGGITSADNVSQLAHIIGGICGGIFGLLLNSNRRRISYK